MEGAQSPVPEPRSRASTHNDSVLVAVVIACSAALLSPLLVPLLTNRVFVFNDLTWFHLPLRHLYQHALEAGDSVLWTPSIFAGLYLHGEGQLGAFHPFHQLLYRVLPLGVGFNLELIANYPAIFAGTFWLLRQLGLSRSAATFGAMLFAFSGFNLLHHHHVNMIAVVAHLPWLLASADVLIVDERQWAKRFAFAGVALVLASEILLGFPQAVWWNALTLSAFVLWRVVQTGRWRRLTPCAAAVVISVLLGAIQLLPTADMAAHSTRAAESGEFALTYSLHPYNLVQVWSPYFFTQGGYSDGSYLWFHEFGIYSGAILPIAAIWIWSRRSALGASRGLAIAALVCATVALVLALGRYGGLAVLLSYVPGIGSLRAPVRYIVLAQFALAIAAAVAFDDWRAIASGQRPAATGPRGVLWIPAVLGVGTMLTLNSGWLPYGRHMFASAAHAVPGVAIVAAVTLLVVLAARGTRWALPALVVVTAVDLGLWGIRFVQREPARAIEALTMSVVPAPENAGESYAAAPARGPYQSNILVLRGYRLTNGYAGLFPAAQNPINSETSLRLSGTRWSFAVDGTRAPFDGAVERVRLVDRTGGPVTGHARLISDRPGHLVVDVETPSDAVVAFTERFHDGWSATRDGSRLETVPVDGDFLGIVVAGGAHRVDARFMPRSFVYGAVGSVLGLLLLAAAIAIRPR
jgi:hypothetical protein